jgi:hypothetical protein
MKAEQGRQKWNTSGQWKDPQDKTEYQIKKQDKSCIYTQSKRK